MHGVLRTSAMPGFREAVAGRSTAFHGLAEVCSAEVRRLLKYVANQNISDEHKDEVVGHAMKEVLDKVGDYLDYIAMSAEKLGCTDLVHSEGNLHKDDIRTMMAEKQLTRALGHMTELEGKLEEADRHVKDYEAQFKTLRSKYLAELQLQKQRFTNLQKKSMITMDDEQIEKTLAEDADVTFFSASQFLDQEVAQLLSMKQMELTNQFSVEREQMHRKNQTLSTDNKDMLHKLNLAEGKVLRLTTQLQELKSSSQKLKIARKATGNEKISAKEELDELVGGGTDVEEEQEEKKEEPTGTFGFRNLTGADPRGGNARNLQKKIDAHETTLLLMASTVDGMEQALVKQDEWLALDEEEMPAKAKVQTSKVTFKDLVQRIKGMQELITKSKTDTNNLPSAEKELIQAKHQEEMMKTEMTTIQAELAATKEQWASTMESEQQKSQRNRAVGT